MVATALGEVALDQLGTTLMHEHVFVVNSEYVINYPDSIPPHDALIDDAVRTLSEAKAAGADTIVDLTVLGLGRMVSWVKEVASRSPVHIITATGIFVFQELPLMFSFRGPGTALGGVDPMTEMFINDINSGIGESGIRASVLKCATDAAGVNNTVRRVFSAIAEAQIETGVPICTHTHAQSRGGLEQQELLMRLGVDLSRVVIGHCGDTTDIAYLTDLIRNGSYVGMDRFGFDGLLPFEDRVGTVAELCRRGNARRILLSHDASCFNGWLDREVRSVVAPQLRFTHLFEDVIPALRAEGVTAQDLRTMLVNNPRDIFSAAST
jgi:phosphotriesterase-related protein